MGLKITKDMTVAERYTENNGAWNWVVIDEDTKRTLWGPGTHLGAEKYVGSKKWYER
jgi:hypothetical protein